ncbi:hypothetical protein N9095_00140 [bacterium]|nr:hypothetical protein [bacterium]
MGVSAGVKAGLKALASSISSAARAAKNFTGIGLKLSDEAAASFSKASDDLVKGVADAGDNAGSLKKAFTDYANKLDDLADSATGNDEIFLKNYKNSIKQDITKAVDDIAEAGGDAATSTKKSIADRLGDAVNSPTGQKLLVAAGVFGGMEYIKRMNEDIAEEKAACISACFPSNWDEYQSNTSVELDYTTKEELETLDLTGGPICSAAKLKNPGCYEYCNIECEKLNPSFLSRYIDPFTSLTTELARDVGEAAGATAAAAAGAAAEAGGAAADGLFKGLGLPLTIAAIVIVLIIIVMMF